MLVQCSYCLRYRRDSGDWVRFVIAPEDLRQIVNRSTSHGVCPACRDTVVAEMKKQLANETLEAGK